MCPSVDQRLIRPDPAADRYPWRIQWARAEWMPPYRKTFPFAYDADGAIDLAKSRFDNHRVLEPSPWPKYYKPAQPITVPIGRGLVAIPRVN